MRARPLRSRGASAPASSIPVAVVEEALERIAGGADLNAIMVIDGERALARARAGVSGRLAGVPLLVKDLIDVAGLRITYGSKLYADRVASETAPCVRALEAEGAIVVATTTCDEFAWGVGGQNAHWGDTGNPLRPGPHHRRLELRQRGGARGRHGRARAGHRHRRLRAPARRRLRGRGAQDAVRRDRHRRRLPARAGPRHGRADGAHGRGLRAGLVGAQRRAGAGAVAGGQADRQAGAPSRASARRSPGRTTPQTDALPGEPVELPVPEADVWPVFYGGAAASHRGLYPERAAEYGPVISAKLDRALATTPEAYEHARAAMAAWQRAAATDPPVDVIVSPVLGLPELPAAGTPEHEFRIPFSAYARTFNFLGWPAIAIGGLQLAARDMRTLLEASLAWPL